MNNLSLFGLESAPTERPLKWSLERLASMRPGEVLPAQAVGAAPGERVPSCSKARLGLLRKAFWRFQVGSSKPPMPDPVRSGELLNSLVGNTFGKKVWAVAWQALATDIGWRKVSPRLLAMSPHALVWLRPMLAADSPQGARTWHSMQGALRDISSAARFALVHPEGKAPDGGDISSWITRRWRKAERQSDQVVYDRGVRAGAVPPRATHDALTWWANHA